MRILHSGDWHLSEGLRFDDTMTTINALIDDGIAHGVHLWALPGDFSGTTVPHRATTEERNGLASLFQRMANHAPVVLVQGNHDAPGDLLIYGKLQARHPIYVLDRPEGLEVTIPKIGPGRVIVFGLPYPQKGWLVGGIDERNIEVQNATGADALRGILADWRVARSNAPLTPAILLAHLNIGGSRVAGGEILIGREIELAPGDLDDLGVDYAALSHIHLHQQMAGRAWYAGSPTAQNHGEQDPKGWLIVDVEAGKPPCVERRESPARQLKTIRIRCEHDPESGQVMHRIVDGSLADVPGADVRLIVDVPEEHAATIDPESWVQTFMSRVGSPHSVTIERRIIPLVRVRSEAIAEARTTAEKLGAYWNSLGSASPAPEARARALAGLMEIESEGMR